MVGWESRVLTGEARVCRIVGMKPIICKRDPKIPEAWRLYHGTKALPVILVQAIAAERLGILPRRQEILTALADTIPAYVVPENVVTLVEVK